MKVIIDITEEDFNRVKENANLPFSMLEINVIANGTPIPNNATNGDMFMVMFPDAEVVCHEKDELVDAHVTVHLSGCDTYQDYSMDWWNAKYKKESNVRNVHEHRQLAE